jgi:hypothetical protein
MNGNDWQGFSSHPSDGRVEREHELSNTLSKQVRSELSDEVPLSIQLNIYYYQTNIQEFISSF